MIDSQTVRKILVCILVGMPSVSFAQTSQVGSIGKIEKMDINADEFVNVYLDSSAVANGCAAGGWAARAFTTYRVGTANPAGGLKNITAALLAAKMAGKKVEIWYSGCLNNAFGSISTVKIIE